MYGTYAWNAGATAAHVLSDLLALMGGAEPAALSASCNKAATVVAGAAHPWIVEDAPYGVISAPCLSGVGVRKLARITVDTAIRLSCVDSWVTATHVAGNSTTAQMVSLALTSAGSVTFLFTDETVLFGSSDWAYWAANIEIKRDGPLLADVAAPNWAVVTQGNACNFPRLKNLSSAGESANVGVSMLSSYGAMTSTTTRDRSERLYIPMVPAVVALSNVPIGEVVGVRVAGGYGLSGDFMIDGGGVNFLLAKGSSTIYAFKRV